MTWTSLSTGAGDFLADGSVAMSGNIELGSNYLSGDGDNEGIFVTTDGNVGVGATNPISKLSVNGAITNQSAIEDNVGSIDFATGNLQYTTNDCSTFDLHNMKSGGSYTLGVQGTVSATCAFNAFSDNGTTALTVHLPPDHAATIDGKHTIYTFIVLGTHLYASWIPDY